MSDEPWLKHVIGKAVDGRLAICAYGTGIHKTEEQAVAKISEALGVEWHRLTDGEFDKLYADLEKEYGENKDGKTAHDNSHDQAGT